MRRKLLLSFALSAPLLFQACADNQTNTANSAPAASPTPATAQPTVAAQPQPVTANVSEVALTAGGKGEADIRLDIAEGYHVNANPASDKFYVPTEVQAQPQEGITPGKPTYPPAVSRKLSFSDKPLAVYEKQAVIKLPLSADASATKGRHTLLAKIRVQPCNDQACLQPRTIEAAIPVTIN